MDTGRRVHEAVLHDIRLWTGAGRVRHAGQQLKTLEKRERASRAYAIV